MGCTLRDRLERAPALAGRVHSIHASAVNLDWHDGGLVTIQRPGALAAPFAAAAADWCEIEALQPALPVRRRGQILELGELHLTWAGALAVDLQLDPSLARAPDLHELREIAFGWSSGTALGSSVGGDACQRLAAGIRGRDPAAFLAGSLGLIGVGPGLTPAGDDGLVGALAVLRGRDPEWLASMGDVRRQVAAAARAGTTAVSGEFIAHALDGFFAEPVLALMRASASEQVERAARALRCRGSTSGADTLAGMALAAAAIIARALPDARAR
jgi:Protein of unknown function (DUF2877)